MARRPLGPLLVVPQFEDMINAPETRISVPPEPPKEKRRRKPRVVVPEEDEYPAEDEYPDPHHMPDPVHFLAQMLIQGEAEARRRKAGRYKNMLGL